jgi:peptidoglycan hydrolase CwlO-like protein
LRHRVPRPIAIVPAALIAALLVWSPPAPPQADAQSEGTVRGRIDRGRERERALAGAAARLGRLERAAAREVGILERRLGAAQAEVTEAETRLATTEQRLERARRRALELRKRLAAYREHLARRLRERYMSGQPDITTVVLEADGFRQLLETLKFLNRVERSDTRLVGLVRSARFDARREQHDLDVLARRQRDAAETVRRRRDALAEITAGLRARRAALARARAARLAALGNARADRRRAERTLRRLLAERRRAARATGPGGPWAIPWAIVQCESGGQNLPPNSAGASGYYQMMPETWAGLGGSTKHAYQAPKAEQDRLAAKLWAGGAGAHNWVCAPLVGAV